MGPIPRYKPHFGPGYRADIDGLRALAIIVVVIFHAFPSVMPGGFVGVDIFFVISGFLISGILLQALQSGTLSFAAFYANRIRRLFPALVLVLAACFAFGWFFLLPDEYERLGKHTVGAAIYVENFVLRREAGYFDIRSSLKPLMHLWSLGIEEQFYLTYPFLVWLLWRWRRNLFSIVVLMAVVSFSLNIAQTRHDAVSAFFLPQTRWWELMVGCAIACWRLPPTEQSHSAGPFLKNAFSVLGVLLIAIAVLRIQEYDLFPGWWALLPVAGAALLVIGGSGAWINRKVFANKPIVFVGMISYPLYLWHWPILTFPRVLRGGEVSVSTRIACLSLSFVLAWVTFRFLESPIRFGRKNWVKPVVLTVMSMILAGLGFVVHRDGFSGRFPKFVGDLGQLRDVIWSTTECRSIAGLAEIDYCRTTSTRTPDALLIGDSHAAVLYDGMASAYRARSLTVMNLGAAGCAPFYNTHTLSRNGLRRDCKASVNQMLEFAAGGTVRTIILSARGPRYMSGTAFGLYAQDSAPGKILWEGARKEASEPEMYESALRQTISLLTRTGNRLILFIDWPELGFDPRSCLPRPVTLFSTPRPICAVSRTEVDARNRDYRELLFRLQKEFPGLQLFDPLPYLCDSSACYAMKDGHLLYSDDNHVSIAGAEYLSTAFLKELQ